MRAVHLGVAALAAVAVANEADGRLVVVFRAPDGTGRLHVLSMGAYDAPAVVDVAETAPNGDWAAPVQLSAAGLVDHLSTGYLHAVANPDGRIELFCSGGGFRNGAFVSRGLHATFSSGTGWSVFTAVPEAASHAVTGSLVRAAGGRLVTFDSDGSRITVSAQQSAYGPWSVPVPIATLGEWFLQQASPSGAWNFNPVLPAPKAITSLAGATSLDLPASMVDLNTDTAFTGRPAQTGDYVGVDLGIRRQIKTVEFVLGQDGAVQQGVVEYSGDGTGWTPLATVSGSPDVTVAPPSGVAVQCVRLRATASQAKPVSVHEIKTA